LDCSIVHNCPTASPTGNFIVIFTKCRLSRPGEKPGLDSSLCIIARRFHRQAIITSHLHYNNKNRIMQNWPTASPSTNFKVNSLSPKLMPQAI
jgi:hypothetical protein